MSLLQENGSTLASIIDAISSEELKEWASFRLLPDDPLVPAQLHKLFWGADEEQTRRDGHRQLPIPTDMSEEDDDDDDIIEGCRFLELGIKGIPYPKIWIRAEYIRIYNALEVCYRKPAIPVRASAVIITGQPGIEKSIWIFYALRQRLGEMKPVIWYYGNTHYLFMKEGVYKVPDEFQQFKDFVWTLVDSDYAMGGLPKVLTMEYNFHFSIYCTSPNQTWWSHLHKIVNTYIFIMNPWKCKEII